MPSFMQSIAAPKMALLCISVISGYRIDSLQPLKPSMGLLSFKALMRLKQTSRAIPSAVASCSSSCS